MKHEHEIRVRYSETDRMGVVHHSAYALYFEEARTEFMRETGFTYSELEKAGVYLPVVELGIRHRRGAGYDDVLVIHCRVAEVERVRLRLEYRTLGRADGVLLAEGHTVHACTDRDFRPRRLPEDLARVFAEMVESGEWE